MTPMQQRPMAEDFIGLPFMLLPGRPADHAVVATTKDGTKVRARQIEGIFNDALLLNALKGVGVYEKTCNTFWLEVLSLAETLYGETIADAIGIWVTLPRHSGNIEWGTEGGVS